MGWESRTSKGKGCSQGKAMRGGCRNEDCTYSHCYTYSEWGNLPSHPSLERSQHSKAIASCLTSICERTNRYMLSPGINPFHRGGQPSTAVFWEAFRDCSFLFSSPCRPSASSTDSIPAGREQPARENDMCRGWMGCDPAGTAGAAGLLFSRRQWLPLSSASASAAQDCERHTLLVQLYSPAFIRKKWVWADKLFSLSFRRCRFWALLLTNSHLHCCTFFIFTFSKKLPELLPSYTLPSYTMAENPFCPFLSQFLYFFYLSALSNLIINFWSRDCFMLCVWIVLGDSGFWLSILRH